MNTFDVKKRKLGTWKVINVITILHGVIGCLILFPIIGVARIFGAKLGAKIMSDSFLKIYGVILSNEQKLLAKEQIYSSGMNKRLLMIMFGIIILLSLALLCLNSCFIMKGDTAFGKYAPDFIIASVFGSSIVGLSIIYCNNIDQQNYSTWMLNKFNVHTELLNLSNEQIQQMNKLYEKQSIEASIVIIILANCLFIAMIGILIYMNTGPDSTIEIDIRQSFFKVYSDSII